MKLTGKKAVVTGAANGIGRRIAEELAGEGAFVILVDRDANAGEKTRRDIEASGHACMFRTMDVTNAGEVAAVSADILDEAGVVDILVNNAGIWKSGTVLTADEGDWDRIVTTNVKSIFLVSRRFIPGMIERKSGAVANIASVAGMVGAADASAYAASKGAVINLTRSMALDFAPHNVRVNCVCPGLMDTTMGDAVVGHYRPGALAHETKSGWQPLSRVGSPEDVAKAVLFMVSDDAAFMTGSSVVVDGGLTAQ